MTPPRLADRLLNWMIAPHLREEVLGDLHERFYMRARRLGESKARRRYWRDLLAYLRPAFIKRTPSGPADREYPEPTTTDMLRNYLKIAFRSLVKQKGYSAINILGLSTGMAVAMLIGLWIYDELSFNQYHQHYDRIAQVMQHTKPDAIVQTQNVVPIPLAQELRTTYGANFKHVILSSWTEGHTLSFGEKKFWKTGNYIEPGAPDMLSLKMLHGTRTGLQEPYSIMVCESVAKAFFGAGNPIGKILKIDNQIVVRVTGVYEDLPYNTQFHNLDYMVPWQVNVAIRDWVKNSGDNWNNNSFQLFVQLANHADMAHVSAQIQDTRLRHAGPETARQEPRIFLQPMRNWHLYTEFKNGVNVGGRIQFVWLFGIIGIFVLLLACINFMNLSTARSEKRAKEVGIRKAVGSVRNQLVSQFLSESFVVAGIAFGLALLLVWLALPVFNEVADKKMILPWAAPWFWTSGLGFTLLTGLVAGSYPAFYLSSFQPLQVLKGTFRVGRLAAVPRKVLVVVQFTVSVTLIIGTVIVFRQIQFAKNRPIGYNRNGLLYVQTTTPDIHNHYDAFRADLIQSGAIVEMAESESPLTGVWHNNGGFEWEGKDPTQPADFAVIGVTHEFGKTVGWQFKEGRDFSKTFPSDSLSVVINEAAVNFMGLKKPVGKMIREHTPDGVMTYRIIGVINDMVMDSPYEPARQTIFYISNFPSNFINLKINPAVSASEAVQKIGAVFQKYDPASPFNYKFADQEYNKKFAAEERIGQLASFFAVLAIFISCLGLFGLASFVAEQRTKEIGVRKVLGASVLDVWSLLSKDFVLLVIIAFGIAAPIAYYFLSNWLQKYEYHTEISWWIFAASGAGALVVTLLTVSFQSVKAALMNPVKSLRSE